MMPTAMAVTTAPTSRAEIAEYARDARLARVAALLIDGFFLLLISLVVNSVYGVTQVTSGSPGGGFGGFYTTVTAVPWPWLVVVGLVYYVVSEAMFGATPGKLAARLRVVRVDGRPLTVEAIAVRNVLRLVDGLPFLYLLGGVVAAVTEASQRLGDIAAGTTVVYRHRALSPGATRSSEPAARRILLAAFGAAVIFTAFFDYFGRPPLVIQGLYNQHQILGLDLVSYSLGPPHWSPGEVTYTFSGRTPDAACSGSITLDWGPFGWTEGSGGGECTV